MLLGGVVGGGGVGPDPAAAGDLLDGTPVEQSAGPEAHAPAYRAAAGFGLELGGDGGELRQGREGLVEGPVEPAAVEHPPAVARAGGGPRSGGDGVQQTLGVGSGRQR